MRQPLPSGRTITAAAFAVAAALLLASCSVAESYLAVVQGTYDYRRGGYQEATVHYLKARSDATYRARVAYDLGNVYHALGEPRGAQEEWLRAEKAKDPSVRAPALFNEGILDYELGDYQKAYEHFRKVLEMTPGDIEAKIDLELSFEKMTTRRVPPVGGSGQPVTVKHTNQAEQHLLNIIRREQKGYFTPPRPAPPSRGVPNW